MTLLTDKLPLRQNLAWGSFANAVASDSAKYLPHRYGVCGGEAIQYNQQRTQFVWADHAVESVDLVLINGAPAQGWQFENTLDVTGRPVAMITMQQPVDQTAGVIARGRGKQHPRTGARMTNAAAILWDVLANIAGRDVAESQLQEFAAACAGLDAAGSIETNDSALTIAAAICASMGGLFSAGARGLATLWPGADTGPSLYTVDTKQGITATASAKLDEIFNDVTVRYAFEAGSPRGSIQLDAKRSVTRYGRRTKTIDATWCANARTAFNVGQRILQQSARPQWNVHADGLDRAVKIGNRVTLNHPAIPVTGDHVVLGTELTFATERTAIDVSAPVGSAPAVHIVQQSEAFDPQAASGVSVQTVGSDVIFDITNNDGSPAVGAAVTIDGVLTRYTDVSGRVTFPASVAKTGWHSLHVVGVDGTQADIQALVP